ncbi:MAG TPA: DUF4350 domain-containing protein [Burkholderiales bacterium]|nr:DUF4350 domain-containing protein [Burkholderiales bacterium]
MNITRKVRAQLLAQGGLYTVLLLVLVMLLAWVARDYRAEWDVTANARNTLSQGTQDALKQFDGPVNITAYAMTKDGGGNDVHKLLQEKLRPWQRVKPDLAVTMVDPRDDPKRANAAGLRSPNEMVIEHKGRTEHLPLEQFNEQNLVNALIRLSRTSTTVIYWLDGHGERKLDGIANHDLGEFGRQLQMKGYKLSSLNLSIAQDVPRNAAALIVASPQADLQDAEVAKLKAHIEGGGNLLWLIDPEPLRGLDPIAEFLGLVLTPGTVVDPSIKPRSGPPTLAVGSNYARHPVTGAFRLNTLFPGSRQIGAAEREGWRMTPLIEVAQRGWVETGKLGDKPVFDEARDFRGPVNIATAFERTASGAAGDRQQRVVVVGNGSFLANAFLGNGGNLQLGVAMLNWLSGDDKMITIAPRPAADAQINIDQTMLYLIALTFLLALPLVFAITGMVVWWRRRKAF